MTTRSEVALKVVKCRMRILADMLALVVRHLKYSIVVHFQIGNMLESLE